MRAAAAAGRQRASPLGRAAGALAALAGLACLALVVVTPLDLRTQAALAAAMLLASALVARVRGATARLALVLLSLTATARYLHWRITTTVGGEWTADAALGAVLFAAELYACAMLALAFAQSVAALRRRPVPLPDDLAAWPAVDVFIPTYDEPLAIVRATVLAAQALDWPADRLRVHLLDDGRREAFRAFAAEARVSYLVREGNAHAKAGNLNHALSVTQGEYVAVFDCDHVPARSFLQVAMGWLLRDPRLALVQTPHHFYSPDPFTRNLGTAATVPSESELFYGAIQPGIDTWNAAFFCGSCAVLRRAALEEVGGIAVETVTEDAHTALKMHRRGWRTAYLAVPQAAGLATETLSAHVGQRIRWARGMAQIFRVDNPLLGRGLGLGQRLCYLAAMLHFFSGIPRLVFLAAPIAYLGFGRHVFNALPLAAVAYGLPHLLHSTLTNARLHGRHRHSFWSEVYETCLAAYISVPTTLALVAPRLGRFNVTAKGGRIDAAFFDARIARPLLALVALNLAALAAAGWRLRGGQGELDSLVINVAWALHNLVVLGATVAAACERPQRRASPRVAARLPAMLRLASGHTVRCHTVDLARGGARVVAAAPVAAGERGWLSLFTFDDERPLPVEIAVGGGPALRLRFAPLALEEEAHLVRCIFSRADAWLRDAEAPPRDRPLRTLGRIAWHALAGSFRILAVVLRRRPGPRAPPPGTPLPAPLPSGAARARRAARVALSIALACAAGWATAAAQADGAPPADARQAPAAPPSAAGPAAAAPAPEPAAAASRRDLDLGPTAAQRDAAAATLEFPFVARSDEELTGARLRLAFAPGAAPPGEGGVEVLLNDERAALLARADVAAGGELEVALDPDLLAARNTLALRALDASGRPLGRPRAWAGLRTLRLDVAAEAVALPDDLALLPLPFVDRGFDAAATVPLVLPGPPDPEAARLGGLVASWLALDAPVPLDFTVRVGALPEGRALVLVDGPAAARRLGLAPPTGPAVRMVDHPHHAASNVKLLVVEGRDRAELRAAAEALAARAAPLVGEAVRLSPPPPAPPAAPYSAPRWVPSGRVVRFSEYPLGAVLAHEGRAPTTLWVRFRVAPDLWIWPSELVDLDLGWTVRAPPGAGAPRLDVELNGYFVATLPAAGAGESSRRTRLRVPREHVRGFNELKVHVRWPEASGDEGGEPPRVAIAGDSVLHLERLGHFAALPDVALFAYDGWPFTRVPDLSETVVALPDAPLPAELATVFTVLARCAQVTGRAATGARFVAASRADDAALAGKDVLAVGGPADHALLARWAALLPIGFEGGGARPGGGDAARAGGAARVRRPASSRWLDLTGGPGPLLDLRRASAVLAEARQPAAVVGMASPVSPGRSVVAVTAAEPARLPPFGAFLGFAEARARAGNDLLVLSGGERWMFSIGPSHGRGHLDAWTRLRWYLANHWLLLLPVLAAGLLLGARVLRPWLARRMRERLAVGGAPA